MDENPMSVEVRLAIIQTQLDNLIKSNSDAKEDMRKTIEKITERFVNIDQFTPIRLVVYGLVGTTLIGVATAVVALVVKR